MQDVLEEWQNDVREERLVAMAASPWQPDEFASRLQALRDAVKHGDSMDRAAAKLAEMKAARG